MLDYALSYAAAGWPVFPCHGITTTGACTCGKSNCPNTAKHPRTRNGLKAATTDPEMVRRWWTTWPDANIGHRPPKSSVIVDADDKPGKPGAATLASLIAFNGPLPNTVTATTGSGGRHYFFKCDKPLPNAVDLLPGIDIRSCDGYVILPLSNHKSGRPYAWAPGCDPASLPIANMPEWLYNALTQNGTGERKVPLEVPGEIPDGERNYTLFHEACRLRELGHTENEIRGLLIVMNEERCTPPLDGAELEIIIGSASKYPIGKMPATAQQDFAGIIENRPTIKTLCASDVEVRDVVWMWHDVFVRGALNSIQGIAGIGKTFLLCAVAASTSNGGCVQSVTGGMEKLPQRTVLYLSGDDDPRTTIVPRLNGFNADLDKIHFAPPDILPPIGSPEFAQLFDAVKPSLAIVDTLQHFLPTRTDLNSATRNWPNAYSGGRPIYCRSYGNNRSC